MRGKSAVLTGPERLRREIKRAERERLENTLLFHLRAARLPEPEREYRFAPGRDYRADFYFSEHRLLVEVDGGTWLDGGGGHNRGAGYERDRARDNLAVILGYRVLRFTGGMVEDGTALRTIEAALKESKDGRDD